VRLLCLQLNFQYDEHVLPSPTAACNRPHCARGALLAAAACKLLENAAGILAAAIITGRPNLTSDSVVMAGLDHSRVLSRAATQLATMAL
jgi:hypothetical protein